MARFVHIDHCLCRYGGHEFDYAVNVLEAAERFGFEVALATNRQFCDHPLLPAPWPVYPVFPYSTYTRHCFWYGGHAQLPFGLSGQPLSGGNAQAGGDSPPRRWPRPLTALGGLGNLQQRRDRRRRIRGFAAACGQLFSQIRLGPDDHAFFATASEFDLLGLARYFRDDAAARGVHWHLQFHFGLYGGCEADEAARRQRRDRVSRQVEEALRHLPTERVRLYNTTEHLTRQYNQLEVGRFCYLPYPVSPRLKSRDGDPGGPLWVACAGAVRRDKKIRDLKAVVQRVRDDSRFDGKLRIAAQLPRRWVRRLGIPAAAAPPQRADVPFHVLPYPLERTAYHELIQRTHVGLFLHDNRRYLAQCSGVLHEMLAAGKPVIVPGGCWLSDQIAEPVAQQIQWMERTLPVIDQLAQRDLVWQRQAAGETGPASGPLLLFFGDECWETQFSVPPDATRAVVGFQWVHQTAATGSYLRLQLDQFIRGSATVERVKSIVGPRATTGRSLAMFPLDPQTSSVRLRLQNAYAVGRLAIRDLRVRLLGAGGGSHCPAGRVGLIAADPAQIPSLLHEMLQHYAHYRTSAAAFSRNWRHTHDPARTIEILTGATSAGRAAAA